MFNFSKKSFLSLAVTSFLFVSSIAFSFSDLISIKPIQKAEAAVGTYYNNVSASKSADLLTSIRSTITSDYSSQGYKGLWTLYKTTDKRSDGKLYDWYSDKTNFILGSGQCGNYSGIGDCYNREHTIPQSWWGGGTDNQGCDGFIVVPTDGKINSVRSNYAFGETTTGTEYKMSGDPSGNRLGSSTSTQYVSGTVFEPFDSRKGDFARIYFYAVARWSEAPTWTTDDGSKVFSSNGNNGFVAKYAQMLIKWHHDDPVSDFEINRNDLVQSKQKNRNPFIDHPSWVDLIWGGTYGSNQKNGETTYTNWKVTNGVISDAGGGGGSTVSVTGVSLNKSSATLTIGDSLTLNATVTPSNATNKNVTWSTSNSGVATVSNGVVSAVNKGTATITATTVDGGYVATCLITVNEEEDPEEPTTLLSITIGKRKDTYYVNDRFTLPEVLANYSDGTSVDVTNDVECSGHDMSKEGTYTVLVVYTDKSLDVTVSTTYEIRVIKKSPQPSNNGCGGEIASTSVIVSLLAVASVITLIISKIRKKESDNNI